MSFCATAALVALAEIWPRPPKARGLPWWLAAPQHLRDWTVAMLMVSLVAGAATSPFAIQHFNRVANYGVFANLSADLLASVVLMPALALSVLLDACGLNSLAVHGPLVVAGWAARAIVWLAHLFATAPGAVGWGCRWPSPWRCGPGRRRPWLGWRPTAVTRRWWRTVRRSC
jgi:competence protein ComEC